MKLASLIREKSNKETVKLKLVSAVLLSVLYTSALAFVIYGSLFYPVSHLVFDLTYAFVYFLLLYEGYRLLIIQQEKYLSFLKALYLKYIVGLLVFQLFSLLLVFLIGIVPFVFILQMEPIGKIDFEVELRLNAVINLLFSGVYFSALTGLNALKSYHKAAVNAEILQKEIAQAQYEGLKNQVNPHFLFNSLNVLSSLVHVDADLSEKFIDRLAKAYRYVLEQRDQELVPLKTEIDFINAFIFLLKIRFEDKLQVNISIPAEKLNLYIPPLTLQLLIENAVKHNELSKSSPLVVDIRAEDDDYLVVQNNVQLRKQEFASTGVGLKNITNQYSYFTPKKVTFQLSDSLYQARVPLLT
ncbi:hypothetical protein GWO68_07430 [Pontibacter sp. BT213]|uniref:Signal transduction histidine kinase internal region domain-containing protein n=1 Tax=Pontibacter fetidus TaxID=2700082 RepID=A0A6B2H085_9BACT|nr:hypothetical protein [Pontibacter fetidus]